MINRTFGSGGDYATMKACGDALRAADPLADDWTFTQISDVTETASSTGYIDLNGHTVTFKSDTPHDGDPTKGWWIYPKGYCYTLESQHAGKFVLQDLKIDFDTTDSYNCGATQAWLYMGYAGALYNVRVENWLIRCMIRGYGAAYAQGGVRFQMGYFGGSWEQSYTWVLACKFLDLEYPFFVFSDNWGEMAGFVCENTTIRGCKYGMRVDSSHHTVFRNVVITDNVGYDWDINNQSSLTLENCADSDGSLVGVGVASDCQSNLVAANEFLSVDDTNEDFLIPKKDSVLSTGGHETEVTDKDIAGIDIPSYVEHEGQRLTPLVYPIGCHVGKYRPGHYRVDFNNSIQGVPDSGGRPLPVNFQYNEQYAVEEL